MRKERKNSQKNLNLELNSKAKTSEKLTVAQEEIRKVAAQIKAESMSAADLLEKEFSGQFWVGNGLIPKGGYALLAALTKEGKTTLALELSLSLATKREFLDQFPVNEKARILYIFAEGSEPGLQKILQKQIVGAKEWGWNIPQQSIKENLIIQPGHKLCFDYPEGIKVIDELVRQQEPDIIILDPISRYTGRNLNKLHNVTQLINIFSDIGARRNCTWIIIHHYRKPSEQRGNNTERIYEVVGSSAFANHCDSFLGLERCHGKRSKHYKTLHFRLRYEDDPEPLDLYKNPETLLFEPVTKQKVIETSAQPEDVVRILRENLGGRSHHSTIVSSVSDELGIGKGRITELLNKAEIKGLVAKEDGHYGKWYVV